ncbi:hypothetical protein fugu_005052 [Takifugu bimaculatus]|uniref:Uncharacterized protein n=1 Tax=Takifugu bimaculatus TaxID=433685 RepID=A0A4Z2BAY1_9TELE|nr:hypothetical protein fugu_005052 [Takifugu bimaculatus]
MEVRKRSDWLIGTSDERTTRSQKVFRGLIMQAVERNTTSEAHPETTTRLLVNTPPSTVTEQQWEELPSGLVERLMCGNCTRDFDTKGEQRKGSDDERLENRVLNTADQIRHRRKQRGDRRAIPERLTVAVFCVGGTVCATCNVPDQPTSAAPDRPPAGAAMVAQAPARTFHVPLSFFQFVA